MEAGLHQGITPDIHELKQMTSGVWLSAQGDQPQIIENQILEEIRLATLQALSPVAEVAAAVARLQELRNKSALKEVEVEALYSIKRKTLQAWRQRRKGPKYVKLGDSVLYRKKDLEAYFADNSVRTIDQRD